jgi:predicted Rossmann-fold nucleotide-binding protein
VRSSNDEADPPGIRAAVLPLGANSVGRGRKQRDEVVVAGGNGGVMPQRDRVGFQNVVAPPGAMPRSGIR